MALTEMYYTDTTTEVTIRWEGALTTAWVSHLGTGISAKGHARHNPEDTYSQTVGSDLAIARAKNRLYRKVEKALVRNSDRYAVETLNV